MTPEPLLRISELAKSMQTQALFTALQLTIQPGECIVLSGDNGAGKTTLLRILAGLLEPDTGYCQYNGRQYDWHHARNWLLRNVVYLHQKPYLFDTSVVDNVAYGLRRHGHCARAARDVARVALQRAGLAHLQQRNAKQLSGGETQRVALLRAWVLSPHLLLLDEPVASMDSTSRQRTLFLIRQLVHEGASLIITAHEPRLFTALANRHLHLQHGRLLDAATLPNDSDAAPAGHVTAEADYHDRYPSH